MSQTEPDSLVEDSGFDDSEQWVSSAVRGANNWLVMIRNATDEGIDEWSDAKTDEEGSVSNGLISYCEGIIAQSLTKNHVPDVEDDPDWRTLRESFHQEDLKYIIDKAKSREFTPGPYLDPDTTEDFTPGASFALSAIIESLKAEVNLGDDIDRNDDLKPALNECVDWIINNKFEDWDAQERDDSAGYAWVGADSNDGDGYEKPRNFFTYTISIVLCDLWGNRDIDVIDKVVSNNEEEIIETIEQLYTFLQYEWWEGDRWTVPTRTGRASLGEEILSSSYAFIGLSYITFRVDSIEISEDVEEKMGKSIENSLNQYEKGNRVWGQTVKYKCGSGGTFEDGSVPYVFTDSLLEAIEYQKDVLDFVEEYTREEIDTKIHTDIVPTILENCWAGTANYQDKGFRHIEQVDKLVDEDDGFPEENMTAIYSTGVAIETFLLNYLNEGDDLKRRSRKRDTSSSTDDSVEVDQSGTSTQRIDKSTTNTIIIEESGDDVNDDDLENVQEKLAGIRSEVGEISENVKSSSNSVDATEIDARSRAFVGELYDLRREFGAQFDENWMDKVCNLQGGVAKKLQKDWEVKFRRKNERKFLHYLLQIYFCSDQDTYENNVAYKEEDKQYLLPPLYNKHSEIDSEWDEEMFQNPDKRKSNVEEMVDYLKSNPWGEYDNVADLMDDFNDRFDD
jgi:hypothetical protein